MIATQLADDLPISRWGVAKHLNSLAGAGLVTVVQRGRDKFYYLTPEPMEETAVWLAAASARWDKRLHKPPSVRAQPGVILSHQD